VIVSDAEKHRPQNVVVHAINETVSNILILTLFSLYCHCTVARYVLFRAVYIPESSWPDFGAAGQSYIQVIAFDLAA